MTDDVKKEPEQKDTAQPDFKEIFNAIMQPVLGWLNDNENSPRTALITLKISAAISADAELSQGVATYKSESSVKH